VNCAIQSYNQTLYVGLTADAQAAPDVGRLKQFVDRAFHELCQAAGVKTRPRRTAAKVERLAERAVVAKPGVEEVGWIGPVGEGRSESIVAAVAAPAGV